MPCNDSGFFDPASATAYGLADYDWSNAKQLWANQKPMNCEELLVEQAALTKAYNNETRVFVYRNFVKALPWYTFVRERISDPAYSGWFLPFGPPTVNGTRWHVPQCDDNYDPPLCSSLYHDQEQTPQHPHGDGSCVDPCDCGGVPCGEYLWDHRNASLRQYLVDNVLGPTGLGDPNISGFFFDDGWSNHSDPVPSWEKPPGACDSSPIGGATEEDYNCSLDMGLVQADTTAIADAYDETLGAVFDAVVDAGGWAWSLWYSWSTPTPAQCAQTFREVCGAGNHSAPFTSAMMQEWTNTTPGKTQIVQFWEDFASFQLVRGPIAYLGYAWVGCLDTYPLPPELGLTYGEPTGTCSETVPGSGVFSRDFTLSTAMMDCNTFKGNVTLK